MKTKRKKKYKTKAGSFAKKLEDPIARYHSITIEPIEENNLDLGVGLGVEDQNINLQELQDIIMEELFMQALPELNPLLARLDQLNEENQRDDLEEEQFNRNIRQRTARGKKRKKRKTRRGRK